MTEDQVEVLRLFIEKVERLNSLSFVRALLDQGSRLSMSWSASTGVLDVSTVGPDSEQVDAFVLTMRMFLQNKDPISVANLARAIEASPLLPDRKALFARWRAHLNGELDAACMVSIDGDHPTRREIMNTIVYGHLSHLDAAHRERYAKWALCPLAMPVVHFEFVGALAGLLHSLRALAAMSREALDAATGSAPPPAAEQ